MKRINVNGVDYFYKKRKIKSDSNYNTSLSVYESNCPNMCKNQPIWGTIIKSNESTATIRGLIFHGVIEWSIESDLDLALIGTQRSPFGIGS